MTINFNSPNYLPNSEQRLEHLRRIINGRPVAILVAGPSISELEERIGELSQADICYFGMNNFFVQENHILKKIGKHFSLLVEAVDNTNKSFSLVFNRIIDFLDRSEDNMLVSSFTNFKISGPNFDFQKFLHKYNNKLLSPCGVYDRTVPNDAQPLHLIHGNSLSWLIYLAIIGKASKISLFGADGYTKNENTKKTYYRSEEYGTMPQKQLMNNTDKGFNPVVPLSLQNIYKTYDLKPIPILNCSEVSFLTPFPKVSYDDAFNFLLGIKHTQEISDLRIPTASIIIPTPVDDEKLKNTLKNIAEQSYSNYETVIVQKSSDFLDAMKKAISSAKGKYVFYCPPDNSYPDIHWINSCLEILENRPQISLVCGLPKNTERPWPKKKFIYYWLKKKNFFPPNMLCVRKQVLEKFLLETDIVRANTEFENWLNFSLFFNMSGYLPAFIPTTIAKHDRTSEDDESLDNYRRQVNDYKNRLIFKKTSHHFRDGDGNILPGKFYLSIFLLYGLAEKVNSRLPLSLHTYLNIAKNIVRKFYQK
ncbi:MAG: hypothetical protein A3B91_02505 [Candidatus Yanofskybacteria bacterium RIFCSPHIGHO2_02_FULL_41_29]|uniref:Uncharacterized protein n=1 Tax=Candidatus Yanofskybacteria bacterium RIFCSPHIGHO2_01_FULL_41_53 TaxID=1802663 RepID=A0A1F8EKE6_9BACT|nr:MAG: hypothetical protein A2650_03005 [Candidatus Yanofskybacteria bacterium RIFCSPHIGHO2_01_FULL_41_53]OGN10310.1 MAG: hypothetical protein A3B91_02505 [Candidatus Yanofskybacteria bacterium RIFCSPHIGHO2_02_FULL_41_29]OGN16719.1 MAG: hypothetical protein A3F48_01625 [Candidatus Yanofskybacteria bacterium RIFCSPHIGHO2_12_FULL_41_9]OGN21835.1 MAG: hypothetical protein A2916_01055 [Candidatus Yanofskybacteria bacterium RIFCSPLOWO2_01_FULL_41_67]OGN30415.1 MAG: hypothetical protein A3H54_00080 